MDRVRNVVKDEGVDVVVPTVQVKVKVQVQVQVQVTLKRLDSQGQSILTRIGCSFEPR